MDHSSPPRLASSSSPVRHSRALSTSSAAALAVASNTTPSFVDNAREEGSEYLNQVNFDFVPPSPPQDAQLPLDFEGPDQGLYALDLQTSQHQQQFQHQQHAGGSPPFDSFQGHLHQQLHQQHPPTSSYNNESFYSPYSGNSELDQLDELSVENLDMHNGGQHLGGYEPSEYGGSHMGPMDMGLDNGFLMFNENDYLSSEYTTDNIQPNQGSPFDHSSPSSNADSSNSNNNNNKNDDGRHSRASSVASHHSHHSLLLSPPLASPPAHRSPSPHSPSQTLPAHSHPSPHLAQSFRNMSVHTPSWGTTPLPLASPKPPRLLMPDLNDDMQLIANSNANNSNVGMIMGVPTINAPEGGQGVDDDMVGNNRPQFHIVPATPISGGGIPSSDGKDNHVPFQQTLATLTQGQQLGGLSPHIPSLSAPSNNNTLSPHILPSSLKRNPNSAQNDLNVLGHGLPSNLSVNNPMMGREYHSQPPTRVASPFVFPVGPHSSSTAAADEPNSAGSGAGATLSPGSSAGNMVNGYMFPDMMRNELRKDQNQQQDGRQRRTSETSAGPNNDTWKFPPTENEKVALDTFSFGGNKGNYLARPLSAGPTYPHGHRISRSEANANLNALNNNNNNNDNTNNTNTMGSPNPSAAFALSNQISNPLANDFANFLHPNHVPQSSMHPLHQSHSSLTVPSMMHHHGGHHGHSLSLGGYTNPATPSLGRGRSPGPVGVGQQGLGLGPGQQGGYRSTTPLSVGSYSRPSSRSHSRSERGADLWGSQSQGEAFGSDLGAAGGGSGSGSRHTHNLSGSRRVSPYFTPNASPRPARAAELENEGDGFGGDIGMMNGLGMINGMNMGLGVEGLNMSIGGMGMGGMGMDMVGEPPGSAGYTEEVAIAGQRTYLGGGVGNSGVGDGASSRGGGRAGSNASNNGDSNNNNNNPQGGTIAKQNVTTGRTANASIRRRKQDANFACTVPGCNSTFTRGFNLKGHLRSHYEQKPYKCHWPGCGKGFARQHDCKRHEQLHSNFRPFECEGCRKQFARMDALNRHSRSEAGLECAKVMKDRESGSGSASGGSGGSGGGLIVMGDGHGDDMGMGMGRGMPMGMGMGMDEDSEPSSSLPAPVLPTRRQPRRRTTALAAAAMAAAMAAGDDEDGENWAVT